MSESMDIRRRGPQMSVLARAAILTGCWLPFVAVALTMSFSHSSDDSRLGTLMMYGCLWSTSNILCPWIMPEGYSLFRQRQLCCTNRTRKRFAPHKDGAFHRNDHEQSCYSFLVYLNEGFEGGNTTIATEPEISIKPKTGMGLLFQHPIIHEGGVVTSGIKYVARTDLMYRTME